MEAVVFALQFANRGCKNAAAFGAAFMPGQASSPMAMVMTNDSSMLARSKSAPANAKMGNIAGSLTEGRSTMAPSQAARMAVRPSDINPASFVVSPMTF